MWGPQQIVLTSMEVESIINGRGAQVLRGTLKRFLKSVRGGE